MVYIKDEVLKEVRSKNDIVDVISSYIPLSPKGKNYFGVCPFHDDSNPSMSVSSDKQIYKCFSCSASGNVFDFIQNYENVTFPEAVNILAQRVGIELNIKTYSNTQDDKFKKEYEIMELTNKIYINNLKSNIGLQAKNYLAKRGITEEVIDEFGIGLAEDDGSILKNIFEKKEYQLSTCVNIGLLNDNGYDVFQRRIVFPLWNTEGKVVGFSGRIFRDEETSKYINSRETKIFKKGQLLYNYHNAKKHVKIEKYVIIVEGFMDAIRLSVSGHKNVVALMGTSMTLEQVELIKKLRTKVKLCLDNDNAGHMAAITNGKLLLDNKVDVEVITMSDFKDPDEYIVNKGKEAFDNLIASSISYYKFYINFLKKNKDFKDPSDVSKYINEVINLVRGIDDSILREIILSDLSNDFNINMETLNERIKLEGGIVAKSVVKVPVKIEKRTDLLTSVANNIIYYMMNDIKYVNQYKNQLGYIDNAELRNLANEITYYCEKNGNINIADFITFATTRDLKDVVNKVISNFNINNMSDLYFNEYLISYIKLSSKRDISKLKEQLANEQDENKKMEIHKQIDKIKKGSVKNERN